MTEFTFQLKELVEHQLTITVEAADADAAHDQAWLQLKEHHGTLHRQGGSSRVVSQSVLPDALAPEPKPKQPEVPTGMARYGRLLISNAVNAWIHEDPKQQMQREMHIRQCLSAHINDEDGHIQLDDALMNQHTRLNPADSGRIHSVWKFPDLPVLWVITDAYAAPEAVTTVLFPDDY